MKCNDKIIFNQFEMSKIVSISIDYNWLGSHSFSNLLYRVLLFNKKKQKQEDSTPTK